MFYGLIYIFQALFKMYVDITNQKVAVVGNVSYNARGGISRVTRVESIMSRTRKTRNIELLKNGPKCRN
jgi:hypothetical protein